MQTVTRVKVTFFAVKDNQEKIRLIGTKIQEILKREKKVLIAVANEEAAKYIDGLLWRIPEESFLPHRLIQNSSPDWVAIAIHPTQNFNEASCLLNLSHEISPILNQFEEIIELWDETHVQKRQASQHRLEAYQAKGIQPGMEGFNQIKEG